MDTLEDALIRSFEPSGSAPAVAIRGPRQKVAVWRDEAWHIAGALPEEMLAHRVRVSERGPLVVARSTEDQHYHVLPPCAPAGALDGPLGAAIELTRDPMVSLDGAVVAVTSSEPSRALIFELADGAWRARRLVGFEASTAGRWQMGASLLRRVSVPHV